MNGHLRILGTRGIPASHGGFETFAEHLALYLVDNGWQVTVYCQEEGQGDVTEADWQGVRRVVIPVRGDGPLASILFDWRAVAHAVGEPGLVLTLGYNTAIFNLLFRLRGITNLINMDGLEWKRAKWSAPVRAWFYANERLGCWIGHHLIADHPEIKRHLQSRVDGKKITVAPYGAPTVDTADQALIAPYGLSPGGYVLIVARPEPENLLLETVSAFSRRRRGQKLVVLGKYEPERNPYHKKVLAAASDEVVFLGAIYDKPVVEALRFFATLYIHGQSVGGTNPSLVEALGAASPVLACRNDFNPWVAGQENAYFIGSDDCARQLDALLADPQRLRRMRAASRARHAEAFTWPHVLAQHEAVLARWLTTPVSKGRLWSEVRRSTEGKTGR